MDKRELWDEMRRKTGEMGSPKEVRYDEEHWELLRELRLRALEVMKELRTRNITSFVHGSIARGDVNRKSDVDVFIPYVIPSFLIETALFPLGITEKSILQATPQSVVKAQIKLENGVNVSFPLIEPKRREIEFYRFGGMIDLSDLNERVAGVNKNLMLIRPIEEGHLEIPISDLSPGKVASILNISQDTVEERMRVLLRRGELGRTGVYLKVELHPDESFEEVLRVIVERDPAVRRRAWNP